MILIGSVFIDSDTFPQVCLKIVCETYKKRTEIFISPKGLIKFVPRIKVGSLYLPWIWMRGHGGGITKEVFYLKEQ